MDDFWDAYQYQSRNNHQLLDLSRHADFIGWHWHDWIWQQFASHSCSCEWRCWGDRSHRPDRSDRANGCAGRNRANWPHWSHGCGLNCGRSYRTYRPDRCCFLRGWSYRAYRAYWRGFYSCWTHWSHGSDWTGWHHYLSRRWRCHLYGNGMGNVADRTLWRAGWHD